MSLLRVYSEDNPGSFQEFTESDAMINTLRGVGIRFERWDADQDLSADASQEEILKAYDRSLKRIMAEIGFATADVISVHPAMPNHPDLRKKFLDEHRHLEDEARFFVDGSGIFYIHTGGKVFCVLCERGDFIDIPAGTTHWFDMGPSPFLKCIRTFNTPEGWVAQYTGSDIALRFPRFDQITATTV